MINLDYASHTPADEKVLAELIRAEREFPGNPLAAHQAGQKARAEITRATAGIAKLIGVKPEEIIYTSGASESNNLAVKGIAKAYKYVGRHILSTCLEHPSVSGTLAALQEDGYEIELVKIQPDGTVDLAHLESAIRPDTVLFCVSAVDSELGAIQPMGKICEIVSRHPNCRLHVDAAQAVGKIPHKLWETPDGIMLPGISTFSFSPHKFYGLCGFGALVKREGVVLEPIIHGGASTTIYRSGTPAVGMISACCKALEIAAETLEERLEYVRKLREYAVEGVMQYAGVRVNGSGSHYILNLSVDGVRGLDFQAALDARGVCVSVKSACSTDNAPSRPVMAVTRDRKAAMNSWRVSFSHLTTFEELDGFLSAFGDVVGGG